MASYSDFRSMSAFGQRNYTSRNIADAYLVNRPEQPISRLFGVPEESPLSESTSDRLIKSSAESVKNNLSKLLLTLQRIKGMLPNPGTYHISSVFSDHQISDLRNYLILDRMLIDRDAAGVIMERQSISVPEAVEVIGILTEYSQRANSLQDSQEYGRALYDYFARTVIDDRGDKTIKRMEKYVPDFNQADIEAYNTYKKSLTDQHYQAIAKGETKLPLLEFVKNGVTYTYNPFNMLEKGAKKTEKHTQFEILTLFKYYGYPLQYDTNVRDLHNIFYKITNSFNWDNEVFFSAPKLNEPQLPLLLRLSQESESLMDQLSDGYNEYIANMHKYSKSEIEQNVKVVEAINNIMMELKEDKSLWAKSNKSPRNFVNILIRAPTSKSDKAPLVNSLLNLGNKAIGKFRGKWDQLAAELARDPRVVNPPP